MVLKKFLNGLPVIGLLTLLTACPVTDVADPNAPVGDDGKKVDLTSVNAGLADLKSKVGAMMSKEEILKEIGESRGIIDPTNPDVAWKKVAQIMAESRGSSTCSIFYPGALPGSSTTKNGPKGGTFSYSATDKDVATLAAADAIADKDILTYEYKDYSVDGIYKLTGKLDFTTNQAATKVTGAAVFLKGATAKKGWFLKATATLNLEPVSTEAVAKKLAGFNDSVAKVEVVFPVDFGLGAADTDGKKCYVLNQAVKITVKSGSEPAGSKEIPIDDPLYLGIFGATGEVTTTA